MGQGGAAILLAARGPRCAAGVRDLPAVTQQRRGGRGGLPVGVPGKGAQPTRPLPASLEAGGGGLVGLEWTDSLRLADFRREWLRQGIFPQPRRATD